MRKESKGVGEVGAASVLQRPLKKAPKFRLSEDEMMLLLLVKGRT